MKKRIIIKIAIFLFFLIVSVFYLLYYFVFKDSDLKAAIKDVTKNTKMVDINLHHNQALDAAEHLHASGVKMPNILINIDTHSDFYFNIVPAEIYQETIAEWVNGYVATYKNVDTVYWVMPDEEEKLNYTKEEMAKHNKEVEEKIAAYGNSINFNMPKDYFYKHPISKEPFVQKCLIDADTSKLFEDIKTSPLYKYIYEKNHTYRKVKIITVTLNSLPDLKGASVFLSIDADYFSNSGFDTYNSLRFIKSEKEIINDFYKVFKSLKEKHIEPLVISMTISPPYLPEERHKIVIKLFNKVCKYSGIKDKLKIYSRSYGEEQED